MFTIDGRLPWSVRRAASWLSDRQTARNADLKAIVEERVIFSQITKSSKRKCAFGNIWSFTLVLHELNIFSADLAMREGYVRRPSFFSVIN